MITIGIDPGITGALAVIDETTAKVFDLPTVPTDGGAISRRISGPALRDLLRANLPKGVAITVVMEKLSAGGFSADPGKKRGNAMTVGSQFDSHATIRCVFECMGLQVQTVTPQRWMKLYEVGKGERRADGQRAKRPSLELARELFPALERDLRRVADSNRAEALLIARWGQKVLA